MIHVRKSIAAMLLSLVMATAAWAETPKVPEAVSRLMQDRNYAEAIAAIDAAAKEKDAAEDYLLYLKGRALHFQHDYDAAIAVFDAAVKKFPESQWARRARFAKGVSYARKGDFRNAELVYRAEAEYLLSENRKQEVADIYLEFADALFKPAKEETPPEYAKALEFYQKALEVGPKADKRIDIELRIAECHQHLGNHGQAAQLFQQFIKDHAGHASEIEARFRLGESQLAAGNAVEARRTWQDLLQLHKNADSPRLPEAAYKISLTYNIPSPGDEEQLSLGVAALRSFIQQYPEHKLASEAHLRVAQSYQNFGRYEDAVKSLQTFLADKRYEKTDELAEGRYLLGYAQKMQGKFDEALATWNEFLVKHPTHQHWANAQREIVDTEFVKAHVKFTEKQFAEARELWQQFQAKYPLDQRNRLILYRFGQMNFIEEKWDEAIADWRRLVSKYPNTNESSQGQFMIAATLEEKLGKLEEALKEYQKVTWGNYQSHAQRRIARLTANALRIATERVFRGGETPQLKLTTRNIESVTVRVYSVDLETYFRKMHLARGVEQLDISLIDPDQTLEFKVPEYKQYQQLENHIDVPLVRGVGFQPAKAKEKEEEKKDALKTHPTAGVLAVTVSSKTLEATSLVLQSDLDILVKCSRDEVFVFAENMRTGKPWPNVRLLISNGQQVFAEGTTGDDGVFRQTYKELKSADDVRVFAIADGHVASNIVGLSGVGVAQGLVNKGYIYTDRPAYRAGQLVHVRGVIRKVAGDVFTVAAGKKYRVDVLDNRNRLVHEAEATLNDFGSFHLHFILPTAAPQGEYRVLVHDEDGKENYQGTFVVHEYQLEPVRLDIDVPRSVYYRGEEIEGTIKASYYYGAPLAGKEIRYQLAGGRTFTETTDNQGEVHFKLPTREFRESQTLLLAAVLPERNLQIGKTFFLSTTGFSLSVETVRSVYLTGETFEASVKAVDAEGKPVAETLTLNVLQRTNVNGKVGEVLVEKHELKTAEKDGAARKTLRLEKGGEYVLRAEGTDRFQNPITAEASVNVSDDKDSVRLRILADRHTFKVGDTASVQLHWREEPALALVTFQGARILDYKLVQLQKGANKLDIPMTATLAPNFELAVAVMTDTRPAPKKLAAEDVGADEPAVQEVRRFHEASSPFRVERDLRVSVAVKPKGDGKQPLRPGDEVEVAITTTDPQGKPVSAEVSLAMVEQALLARFSSPLPAIDEFFRAGDRESAVRTTSSVTFSYAPQTRPINPQLLAEADRLDVREEERRLLANLNGNGEAIVTGGTEFRGRDGTANFDDLIGLIRSTNGAQSWDDVGGPGAIDNLSGNLSLQVEQRQELHSYGGAMQSTGQSLMMQHSPRVIVQEEAELPVGGAQWGALSPRRKKYASVDLAQRGGEDGISAMALLPFLGDTGKLQVQNKSVQVLDTNGVAWHFNAGDMNPQKVQEAVTKLANEGAVLLPHLPLQETGYWNPAIATDDKGQATVTVTLPERSTAWSLLAKGITVDTLAGEATDELTAKKDLFGQLKLPLAFTDGDAVDVIASVHNDALDNGQIEVTLKTTIGGKSTTERKTLDVQAKGISELVFKQKLELPADAPKQGAPAIDAQFELTVAAGERRDVIRETVPLNPYGMPVFAIAAGSSAADVTAFVDQPPGMTLEAPRLQVIVGPTVEQSLLDVVLSPPTWCQIESYRIASGVDTAVSDLMASLALQKLFGASRDANSPQSQALDARVRSSISLLVSLQNNDGGWSWAGASAAKSATGSASAGVSDRYSSARVAWGLSVAKAAGYRVADDGFNKAVNYLQTQLAASRVTDYETKAVLLHALTVAGHEDFPLANQLYRNRPSLSPAALAHLALTFAEMDRKQTAAELLDLLSQKVPKQTGSGVFFGESREGSGPSVEKDSRPLSGTLAWNRSDTELRALYALALDKAAPSDARLAEQVDWLLAHRTGHRWSPDKATGPAMLALCDWFARTRFTGERYKLTMWVNDLKAHELEINDDARTQTFDIPANLLVKDRQRVRFEITGRGRFTYQCVLGGFVAADKLKSTTQDWKVVRHYEPAPLELDGREIPRGFDVLTGNYTTFRNELSQLPVARRGQVDLRITRYNVPSDTPQEQLDYLVITEPLPAGTTVIENSVQGGFERFEIAPGSITFYVGSRQYVDPIRYDVHGYLPGQYRTTPTLIRNAYRPDQIAVATPKSLAVLPLGDASADKYRPTPRELYELGKRHFDKGDLKTAAGHLSDLFANWNLAPNFYKDSARMLLDIHLQNGPANEVVRYFEIIIEKYPDLEIPFAKLVQVGDAYHQIGEYERSYLVFRATVEASFMRESQVAGFLESQSEFTRSVDVMTKLLRQYPPEAYVATADYSLAQRVFAKAPEAATDAKLREKHVTRVDLVRQSLAMLDNFLTAYPEDPAADQASFSLANALLELEAFQQTIDACQRYATRYPSSDYLDSFWYIIGYCHFARGEHQQALDMCNKVAEHKRLDKQTGRAVESPNKWQAIYILGQIYHSLGKAAEAIREYTRVEERFADARQAIDYFARKAIELPEVTTFKPGEAASVELKFRNIPSCDATVYRIDLMKYSLLRRNLSDITSINLAGIRPYHEAKIELGDGKDYRDRTTKLPLPLKEEGAYLVVCRGGDLHTSGMVLVTPLVAEVQEEAPSGRVRTTVRDVAKDSYASNVHVKVIGTSNGDFVSGETDLRGVFVADAIRGRSMVIAQAEGGRYAFYRGTTDLGPPPAPVNQPASSSAAEPAPSADPFGGKSILLENIQRSNSGIQIEQQKQLQDFYQNDFDRGIKGFKF
jgi:uncharacterized protein YfaS (alpha-2-macroglobulin family)/TolA-binding protein